MYPNIIVSGYIGGSILYISKRGFMASEPDEVVSCQEFDFPPKFSASHVD